MCDDNVAYVYVIMHGMYYTRNPQFSQTNYEECKPTGILKANWLHKQCHQIPSLVVFFFDLDWDDPQWEQKETECASKIQVIRCVCVFVCVCVCVYVHVQLYVCAHPCFPYEGIALNCDL